MDWSPVMSRSPVMDVLLYYCIFFCRAFGPFSYLEKRDEEKVNYNYY